MSSDQIVGLVVLVCGGRWYWDRKYVFDVLDELNKQTPIKIIIHGAARGADKLADIWAKSRGVSFKPYPADWVKYGNGAGPIRNIHMLKDSKPDLVVAFPGNKGTAHMVSIAKKAGIKVIDHGKHNHILPN